MSDDRASNCDGDDSGEGRSESDGEGTSETRPSLNATFGVLSHHHRREILRHLIDAPDHVADVEELAGRLVEQQAERTGERPAREEVEIELHHLHLPRLVEAGIVEYDDRSGELRYWPDERVEGLLTFVRSEGWD